MKTGRGWSALAGMVAVSLAMYVGAYYAMVDPFVPIGFAYYEPAESGAPILFSPEATYPRGWMYPFFEPIHQIDRRLRPQVWWEPDFSPENSN